MKNKLKYSKTFAEKDISVKTKKNQVFILNERI